MDRFSTTGKQKIFRGRCKMMQTQPQKPLPRVVVIGLASCFGCQLQITNQEPHLLSVLGQIDLSYWQLISSDPMPEEFDVAIIEGAVTTKEAQETLQQIRKKARVVISLGSCAHTAGIPGIAAASFESRAQDVYQVTPTACGEMIKPQPVNAVITVDYQVLSCPVDFFEFVRVLSAALYGSNHTLRSTTMCNECKRMENECFYARGEICMGLVTNGGCMARCPSLGRPCNGCRGLSPEANIASAHETVGRFNLSVEEFDKKLELFNQVSLQAQ